MTKFDVRNTNTLTEYLLFNAYFTFFHPHHSTELYRILSYLLSVQIIIVYFYLYMSFLAFMPFCFSYVDRKNTLVDLFDG
jgi:hypothetical protein